MEGAKNYWWFGAGPVCSEISRDFWGIPLVSKITWWKLKDQKFLNLILLHCWKKHLGHFPVTLSSSRLLLFGFLLFGGHQSLGANTASAVSKSCWIHQWYDTTFYPGKVKDKRGDNIQMNAMLPAGKTTWKWHKKRVPSTMKVTIQINKSTRCKICHNWSINV